MEQRPLQRCTCTREIRWLLEPFGEGLLCLAASLLCPLEIDLGRHIGSLCHHDDLIRPNLEETTGDGEELFLTTPTNAQLPDSQGGQERRMVRQNTQLPLNPGTNNRVNFLRKDLPLRRNNLKQ